MAARKLYALMALLVLPTVAAVTLPEHPIQDATTICEPVLDEPLRGDDAYRWLGDPNLPFFDLDVDGFSNDDELIARSDPTYRLSTPFDHDADGTLQAFDECDFDPRVQ